MTTPDPDPPPRWSFTWLLRIQRTARPPSLPRGRSGPGLLTWLLAAIVVVGLVVLTVLDFVPR